MFPSLNRKLLRTLFLFLVATILYESLPWAGLPSIKFESIDSAFLRIEKNKDDQFKSLLLKESSNLSESEKTLFLSFKEQQYKNRREHVSAYCDSLGDRFEKNIRKNSIVFNAKDSVSYCPIAKVASSTWCDHFINLCG